MSDSGNHAVRKITPGGVVTTIAGVPPGAPVGLKVAPDGSLVVADTGNNVIRRVTLSR